MAKKASGRSESRAADRETSAEELEPPAFVFTAGEFNARFRDAGPPTEDDVTITPDGRRLDTREAVLEFAAEVAAERAAAARGGPPAENRE